MQKPECLDFEAMLKAIIEKHTAAILATFQYQLQASYGRAVFGPPGVVTRINERRSGAFSHYIDSHILSFWTVGSPALRIHLCADEVVIVTIDLRTGRITLRDTGDLAAAGRVPRFTVISEKINEDPTVLFNALFRLRFMVRPEFDAHVLYSHGLF